MDNRVGDLITVLRDLKYENAARVILEVNEVEDHTAGFKSFRLHIDEYRTNPYSAVLMAHYWNGLNEYADLNGIQVENFWSDIHTILIANEEQFKRLHNIDEIISVA